MITAAVLTISDSVVAGTRQDRSGAVLEERIVELGWTVASRDVVPDETDEISRKLRDLADIDHIPVVFTTGGTGIAWRDVTPEATRDVIDREIPGVAEVMRADGRKSTPLAALSRGLAGSRGTSLIVNLPGSPKGALESLNAIVNLVPHIVDLLHGRTAHP